MGSTQELSDADTAVSEVISSENCSETDLCVIQESIKNSDGSLFNIRKIQISQKTLDTQVNLLRFIVKTVQKLVNLPSSLFVTYNKVWFEGSLADACEKLVDAEDGINGQQCQQTNNLAEFEVNAKSDTVKDKSTFLCISIKSSDSFVTLEEWLKDRENVVLYEVQIVHILTQVISLLSMLLEKGITKSNFSTRDIFVFPQFGTQTLLAPIKLGNLNVERLDSAIVSLCQDQGSQNNTQSNDLSTTPQPKPDSPLQSVAQVFADLVQRHFNANDQKQNHSLAPNVNNAEVLELIKEVIMTSDETTASLNQILAKLEKIKEKYSKSVFLGITEPKTTFVGRESELTTLLQLLEKKNSKNSIIILHGKSGSGKSELVNQLAQSFTRTCDGSIICFNASSVDALTSAVISFSSYPTLNISTRDYIGNSRGIRNVFSDMLQYFTDKNLLVVFENVNEATEELLDLIQVFKETSKSEGTTTQNLLMVTRNDYWSNSTTTEHTLVSLSNLNSSESVEILAKPAAWDGRILLEAELEAAKTLAEKFNHIPLSLELVSIFIKQCNIEAPTYTNMYSYILELFQTFKDAHPDIVSLNATSLYYFVLSKLHETLNEEDKRTTRYILYVLQYIDGNCGILVDILINIITQFDPDRSVETIEKEVHRSIDSLSKFGLIGIRDKIIYLPLCKQESLKEVFVHMFKPDLTLNSQNLLCVLKTVLLQSSLDDHHQCWKLVPHAIQIWTTITGTNPNHAKQFDSIPELIATTAKALNKFEEITHFVKKATEIFTSAFGSPHEFHVLKLKFLIAEESLLRKARVNEAFTIFKTISEQSHAEPKDSLMLKLKSLIHLGRIHITRQEYEKAISCCQQVQIFAVQKISRLQLDSEPIVLKARMLHGYAYLQQNNLEEGKKILLQVIPLMERYSGPDASQIRGLITEAKFYLATLLRKNGDLVNALMMQTKVLEERERVLGRKHPDTWSSKQEMAMLYSSYDNHDKALLLLREVLEIQEEVLGAPSNRQSLQTMNAIAEIEAKLGNFDDALELYEAIDLIEQQVLGESDEMRISSQLKQADVLVVLGQYKEAIDIFDLVIALQTSVLEENSGRMKLYEEIVAKREKADRSMEIVGNYWFGLTPDNLNNPSDLETLAKKHEVAMELCENTDHHGALRFLREVQEDCTHLDDTNRFHLNVKADLARVLGLVGKFNESFSVYKEIIPFLDATFGECDELTMLCKDTMGQVFLFSGNQFLKRQMSNLKWFLL
ncbi:Nephrocystin-3 [Orchesella cincta]|uniref:Nephrocystin-3 n=1 Tax=Orchesella cincta TaxID=48709 RepID=A0A1D2NKI7_ORCCI|nr:Nephrocystin-3 [Orchesella cincta]